MFYSNRLVRHDHVSPTRWRGHGLTNHPSCCQCEIKWAVRTIISNRSVRLRRATTAVCQLWTLLYPLLCF